MSSSTGITGCIADSRCSSEIKKDLRTLSGDREKKRDTISSLEKQIHTSELDLADKRQALKEREAFERQKEDLRSDIADLEGKLRVSTSVAVALPYLSAVAAGHRSQAGRDCDTT